MVSHKSKFSREVRDKGQVDVGNKQNTFGNKLNKMAHLRHQQAPRSLQRALSFM